MKHKGTLQILTDARGLIHKYGWIRGDLGNRKTGHCAVGALRASVPDGTFKDLGVTWEQYVIAARSLEDLTQQNGTPESIARWNDSVARDKEEVLEMFDWAIGIEQAGGI